MWSLSAVLLLAAIALSACAQQQSSCYAAVFAQYTSAQASWQRGLREEIVLQRPQFEAVATTGRDVQLVGIEPRRLRFQYLLENDPDHLNLRGDWSAFINFSAAWTEDDTEKLSELSPQYRRLRAEAEDLAERNSRHEDWPALREFVRDELMDTEAYQGLLTTFLNESATAGSDLERCSMDSTS